MARISSKIQVLIFCNADEQICMPDDIARAIHYKDEAIAKKDLLCSRMVQVVSSHEKHRALIERAVDLLAEQIHHRSRSLGAKVLVVQSRDRLEEDLSQTWLRNDSSSHAVEDAGSQIRR